MQAVRIKPVNLVRKEEPGGRLLVSSFKEARALKMLENFPAEWQQLNAQQCSRVYPKGSRSREGERSSAGAIYGRS